MVFDGLLCFKIYVVSPDYGVNIFQNQKKKYPKILTDIIPLASAKTNVNEIGIHNSVNYEDLKRKMWQSNNEIAFLQIWLWNNCKKIGI